MTTTAKIVDRLGVLKANIAALTEQERLLKDQLIEQGVNASYDGDLFRATVIECEHGKLDVAAAKRKLGPKWVKRHTTYTDVITVRVVARIRDVQKEAA